MDLPVRSIENVSKTKRARLVAEAAETLKAHHTELPPEAGAHAADVQASPLTKPPEPAWNQQEVEHLFGY